MNDKIRALAQDAGQGNLFHIPPEFIEKFAELIVGECMTMCKTAVGNRDYNTGRLHCLENIKEHFGVKE